MNFVQIRRDKQNLTLEMASILSEQDWKEQYSIVQKNISEAQDILIELDFGRCTWCDPIILLQLYSDLYLSSQKNNRVIIQFPAIDGASVPARKFLKFLAREGFLNLFLGKRNYELSSNSFSTKQSFTLYVGKTEVVDSVINKLSAISDQLLFERSTCVKAMSISFPGVKSQGGIEGATTRYLESIDKFLRKEIIGSLVPTLDAWVPTWVHRSIATRCFGTLREMLYNIVEHAYRSERGDYLAAGVGVIYVRYRDGLVNCPPALRDDLVKAIERERKVEKSNKLAVSFIEERQAFFEIFVVDSGCGITKSLAETRYLNSIMSGIFKSGLSRKLNHPTKHGGLHLVGELLELANDYLRVYDDGLWWGTQLPKIPIENDKAISLEQDERIRGTSWTTRISWKVDTDIETYDKNRWVKAWLRSKKQAAIHLKRSILQPNLSLDINVFDYRFEKENASGFHSVSAVNSVIFLDHAISKRKIIRTLLESAASASSQQEVIYFCDIRSEEACYYIAALCESESLVVESISRLKAIVLLSRSLAISVLTRRDSSLTFTYDKRAVSEFQRPVQTPRYFYSFTEVVGIIREIDSHLLWRSLGVQIEEGIVSDNFGALKFAMIKWGKLRLTQYLDIPYMLSFPTCKELLLRGLDRLEALDPESSLRFSTNNSELEGFLEIFKSTRKPKKPKSVALIGSVMVTGNSSRYTQNNPASTDYYLFVHPEGGSTGNSMFLWPAISVKLNSEDPIYERVGRTSEIAIGGWRSNEIPKLKNQRTLYGEGPAASYMSWQDPSRQIMKLGHWMYGKNHDLLSPNLLIAFDSQLDQIRIQVGSSLAQFIYDQLFNIFNLGLKDLTSEGKEIYKIARKSLETNTYKKGEHLLKISGKKSDSSILIYPSHTVTDYVVNSFLLLISKGKRSLIKTRILPLSNLSENRSGSGFRVQSLSKERLLGLIGNSDMGTSSPIIIFDDAMISGRTINEIENFLGSLNLSHIYRLGFIDRQRLPSAHYLDPNNSAIYWRFDIPILGNHSYCPLCKAVEVAAELEKSLYSELFRKRVKAWITTWKARNPITQWGDTGLASQVLDLKHPTKRVGVKVDEHSGKTVPNSGEEIRIDSTAGLLVWALELQTMTGKHDLVLDLLKVGNERYEPNLDIESQIQLIASQLFLLNKETELEIRIELVKHLVNILFCKISEDQADRNTSLACMALMIQEPEVLVIGTNMVFQESQISLGFLSNDAKLFATYCFRTGLEFHELLKSIGESLQTKIGRSATYFRLHTNIKDVQGDAHSAPIAVLAKSGSSLTNYLPLLPEVSVSCDLLLSILESGDFERLAIPIGEFGETRKIEGDKALAIQGLKNIQSHIDASMTELNFSRLQREVLSVLPSLDKIHRHFFMPILLSNMRRGENSGFIDIFETTFLMNLHRVPQMRKAFGESNFCYVMKKHSVEENKKYSSIFKDHYSEVFLIWDNDVRNALSDILLNTRHCAAISCSSGRGLESEKEIHLWVDFEPTADGYNIFLENFIPKEKVSSITEFNKRLLRLRGIQAKATVNRDILVTQLNIPFAHILTN